MKDDTKAIPGRVLRHHNRRGFSLVELLVVIGIISLLISLLLPALSRARGQAMQVQCMSNQRQIGMALLDYTNTWNGYLFPPGMGADIDDPPPNTSVWPCVVFGTSTPPILVCPNDPEPAFAHSYVLNGHLRDHDIKYWSGMNALHNLSASQIIVMGEKVTTEIDYYMDPGDFDKLVEPYRHGLNSGSNYLMLDMHVETLLPGAAWGSIDPWDLSDTSGDGTNEN